MTTISELTYGDRTYRFSTPQVLHETRGPRGRIVWIETTNDERECTDICGEDDPSCGRDAMEDLAEDMDASWRWCAEFDESRLNEVARREKAWLLANVDVVEAKP